MSRARLEILRLIAEGKISPEEGERLLDSLPDGDAPPEDRSEEEGDAGEGGRRSRFAEGMAVVMDEISETIRQLMGEARGAAQRVFEEHAPHAEAIRLTGGTCPIPPGARLKVQQAIRFSFGGTSRGGNVILREVEGENLRILRGEAVEMHRNGEDYSLTWAKGVLELEIPSRLSSLLVRCVGSDLEVHGCSFPASLETTGGEIRVQSPRAPFRLRTVGGRVRVADFAQTTGSSSISTTGGDCTVEASRGSSVTFRAAALGGAIRFPEGTETEAQGRARRRAVAQIGAGEAEVKIDTLGGDIEVRVA